MQAAPDESGSRGKVRLVEEGRAFFCSELVAKAYKVCGIMQQTDEACSNWLPGDMTSKANRLNLVEGAKLGKEELIFTQTMFDLEQREEQKKASK